MIRKLILKLLLAGILITACRKNEIERSSAEKQSLKEKVMAFIDAKKEKAGEQAKATIDQLKESIDWNDFSTSYEPFFKHQQTAFTIKNESVSARTGEDTYTCLFVRQNSIGTVVNISTLEITIPDGNTGNLGSLALSLVNNDMQSYSGTMTRRNLYGYYIYQIEIENGTAEKFRRMKKGNTGGKGQLAELTETCVDWYWQTYENGILISEVFLFSDCSQGVEEGGSGNNGTGGNQSNSNPCNEVDSLAENGDFQARLDTLRQGWGNNFEIGYSYTGSPATGYNFIKYQGLPGAGVEVPTNGPVRGIIHNHNISEPFSIFSPDDLRRMYQVFYNNQADTGFSFTLVTNNTSYVLKVDNLAAFMQFGQNNLLDNASFFWFSYSIYTGYDIKENNPAGSNELGFLRMLSGMNTGLKLFAGSEDFETWDLKGVDPFNPNNIVTLNCQ